MQNQDMFVPFFCNNCGQLAFICKKSDTPDIVVLEFDNASWKIHQCFAAKGENIWSHHSELIMIEKDANQIPVKFPGKSKKGRLNQLSYGVLIGTPQHTEDNQQLFVQILTVEGSLIQLRSVEPLNTAFVGMLVDLSAAKKIGTDKFRVNKLTPFTPEITGDKPDEDINRFFSFKVSANDQEQLESFVDRFIGMLSQKNLYLVNITPLQILSENGSSTYQRQLTAPSALRLQKAIANMAFPESIRISVQ
ncbi:MAG: hypothetical protein MJE63_09845 [Proteobacteria bacterium]|nr:hypothetical protein [Pseudomonadota bacterium]